MQGEIDSQQISYRYQKVNGIKLHVAIAGPVSGNPVILLHGFPDAHFGWEKQILALAQNNFYVIAPDQRGYNLSDKPKGKKSYMMNLLTADIIALADSLGIKKFNLAGHDFGALVCWNLADKYPERIMKMVIINVPHPKVAGEYLRKSNRQRLKSWYAFFFMVPFIPELAARAFNWKVLISTMKNAYTKEELERYKAAWSQHNAISSMINWYRCLPLQNEEEKPKKIIEVPTFIMWGKLDPHLLWEMVPPSAAMCETVKVQYFEDSTHWVLKEKAKEVSKLLIEYFKQ